MLRWLPIALSVAVVLGAAALWYASYIPDLPPAKAEQLIAQAPEFSRYARLIKVQSVFHYKDSMDSVSHGEFTFQYLNAPANAPIIKSNADFRYWDGTWHLNQFDYGSPYDCHIIDVYNGLPKHE